MSIGGQVKVLNARQWAQLEKVGQSVKHQTIWALLRFTGCRSCEARQLMVDNVYLDPENRILREAVYFPKQIRKGKKRSLSVFISDKLEWYLQRYQPPQTGYLFPSPRNPEKPISYEAIYKYMKNAVSAAGLGHLKIATHSGRRSLVTNLYEQGIPLPTIQGITGHMTLQNLKPYVELREAILQGAVNNVAL
ncbi:MAG: site-specific integrase [Crocosphaera sp.]|nr:site-specific integrase [Crocosphaera sp.]